MQKNALLRCLINKNKNFSKKVIGIFISFLLKFFYVSKYVIKVAFYIKTG